MAQSESPSKSIVILAAVGLIVAVLSALENHIAWVAAFCGLWGGGCQETAVYHLLGIPLWLWGLLYYAVLAGCALFLRPAVFWLVMVGLGVEIGLIEILVTQKLSCLLCLLNAVVVLMLVIFSLRKDRIWQTLAVGLLSLVVFNILIPPNPLQDPGEKTANVDDAIVAKVGDTAITDLELERPLSTKIYRLQQDIFKLKQRRLAEMIDDTLLRKEAAQKGTAVEKIINAIPGINDVVSDEAVNDFYLRNESQWVNWSGTREDLLLRIREYLQDQQYRKLIRDHAQALRKDYPVTVYLNEPPLPHARIALGSSPVTGPEDASVIVVEFSDYLCPACRRVHETSKKIRERYGEQIRWVFKDFPLKSHKGAKKLAEAARCAGDQGKFWEFQDVLFASKDRPDLNELLTFAEQLDLNADRFSQCYQSGRFLKDVEKDIEDARQAGINSTPSFVINGRLHPGSLPLDKFAELIEAELPK